ncbi:VanW family protein [Phytohabitans suffuscus]|uniref:Vanomycin resistance protein VanB n=1 Tax=Phytohabitans suffuscus TaxID=624315 RepID=A0A6F8Z082_9ACTN|nr:VanW family protein [Phytohabitans suffuscus]BCB91653.1 vanomycin resistance protein VanB [Phytohabitans suffuscus]
MTQPPRQFADEAPTVQFAQVGGPAAPGGPGGFGPAVPDGPEPAPDRGRKRILLAGGITAAVLVAIGGAAAYGYAGEVPRGTTVLGIALGAKSKADAAAVLRAGLSGQAERLESPLPVRLGERVVEIKPADVGLAIDVDATVAAAADSGGGPFSRVFGSRAVAPVVAVDVEKADDVLRAALGKDAQAMTMPAVTFSGTTPKAVHPKPGMGLDAEKSAQALREGWLGIRPVPVPLVEVHPATTADEVDKLVAELARPAVAAPVTVTTERGDVTVPPAAIAKSLVLTADKTGKINPRVDEKKLRAALATPLAEVEVAAKDATMALKAGKPAVVPGVDGHRLDTAALSKDLLAVLPKADARTLAGTMTTAKPKVTEEDVAKLGVKEKVSTFTTNFPGGLTSARSQNIVLVSKETKGAFVMPGATFSLNTHTGERSYPQGYKDAPTIVGGKLVPGAGGGVSQFVTTLFNATYYAGLEDVEHKPHSYYFSRYPAVIESTIYPPHLDFRFRNNTPYGVLIDTSYTSSSITVSIWSTKIYDSVKTEWGPRRNITQPQTRYLEPGPSCIATGGLPGFSQDAWRIFRKDGKETKREKFSWTYQAEPRFICGKAPA